jgi:hypothetical protein
MSDKTPSKSPRIARSPRAAAALAVLAIGVSVIAYFVGYPSPGRQSAREKLSGDVGAGSPLAAGAALAQASAEPGPMSGPPAGHRAGRAAKPTTQPTTQPTPAPGALWPSNPAAAASWNAGQPGKALAHVTALSGDVLMAHGSGQYAQMLQACEALYGQVGTAAGLAPIPDTAMQGFYAKSLTAFKSGIAACEAGITQQEVGVEDTVTHVNQADVQLALTSFGTGVSDLYISTESLRKH